MSIRLRSADATLPQWIVAFAVGITLSVWMWQDLLRGGGLNGGDTYSYFLPAKQVLKEAFTAGTLPLWNDRTGLGYPLHAESQAGVFYPTNQLLYRLWNPDRAYAASIVLHYALAFVFCWRFVRTQQVSHLSALLAAMVWVYGWFPARLSLEWAVIGGVWLPLCLWMTDRLLQQPGIGRFSALAACLSIHLLAGHFTLAFITQLTCMLYAALRSWLSRDLSLKAALLRGCIVVLAVVSGLLLAAIQLLPTLELRQLSQRSGDETSAFNPGYGHLPPVYITQVFASWFYWHSEEIVATRGMLSVPALAIAADTNPVEAHMYFGLLPLCLVTLSLLPLIREQLPEGIWRTWALLSCAALIYATGWLLPITQYLPGFRFFMGPGRYTIVTSLGAVIVAGMVLDVLLQRRRWMSRCVATGLVAAITLPDLLAASRFVSDAVVMDAPPLAELPDSWVRRELQAAEQPPRLLAPGPNVANAYGVSCLPQYLGLGPAEYYQDEKRYRSMPPREDLAPFPSPEELQLLRERGITHVLQTEPLINPAADLELVASGPDAFLNTVWSRGLAPCWLYRIRNAPQRVTTQNPASLRDFKWLERTPVRTEFRIELGADDVVRLNELMYPGWTVQIDGAKADPVSRNGFQREVHVPAGVHRIRWAFQPHSVRQGMIVSAVTLLCLVAAVLVARRR